MSRTVPAAASLGGDQRGQPIKKERRVVAERPERTFTVDDGKRNTVAICRLMSDAAHEHIIGTLAD